MKKLEELFNLPESKKTDKKEKTKLTKKDIDEFSRQLPSIKGLGDATDTELDDIASKALTSYEDIIDIAMNVEQRFSARLFEVANQMLKTGLDARVKKMEKKLKIAELQIKRDNVDAKIEKRDGNLSNSDDAAVITDRNSLIEQLQKMKRPPKVDNQNDSNLD